MPLDKKIYRRIYVEMEESMNKKRIISLGVVGILTLCMVACGGEKTLSNNSEVTEGTTVSQVEQETTEQLNWLNTDGKYPVVQEGTDIKL